MNLLITVDTEADNQWKGNSLELNNINYLTRFHDLCIKYGFLPTYFVTYEVVCDPKAVAILNKWHALGQAEIGAHLHPWSTPPISEEDTVKRFPSELSDIDLKEKFTNLTQKITDVFGAPTSYRAGRWGFDKRQEDLLKDLGYIVDSSVSPKVSWIKEGGPDFCTYSVYPVMLPSGILEVPMTIVHTGFLNKENSFISRFFNGLPEGLIKKICNKLFFKNRWLRIFGETKESDWIAVYDSVVKNKLPVIQFMIHSSELMPGGSPYTKTKESVEVLYEKIEKMFSFFKAKKMEGVTISSFAKSFKKSNLE